MVGSELGRICGADGREDALFSTMSSAKRPVATINTKTKNNLIRGEIAKITRNKKRVTVKLDCKWLLLTDISN